MPDIPIPIIKKKKSTLKSWLSDKCDGVSNVFEDPGYSDYYISFFNIYDSYNDIYKLNDIDICKQTEYIEDVFNTYEITEFDDVIEKYLDYIPLDVDMEELNEMTKNLDNKEKYEAQDKLSRKAIAILPGSNRSNSNFLFKALLDKMYYLDTYYIPYVSSDIYAPFTDKYIEEDMNIDKNKLYDFIYKYSKK